MKKKKKKTGRSLSVSLWVLTCTLYSERAALHLISIVFATGFPERSLSIVIIVLHLFSSIIILNSQMPMKSCKMFLATPYDS